MEVEGSELNSKWTDNFRVRVTKILCANRTVTWLMYGIVVIGLSPNRKNRLSAASKIVTPYAGFMLSQHYLSQEIVSQGLTWLNPNSKRLKRGFGSRVKAGQTVYCQVDQLEEFYSEWLPAINGPVILITGKAELPGLCNSEVVRQMMNHPKILVWFSQNQIYKELRIHPFPYGVSLDSAPTVIKIAKEPTERKTQSIFIPYVAIHPHLVGKSRLDRELLSHSMSQKKPLVNYLREIAVHQWVVCPAGDRPDTYRHWETIALGSTPITCLPETFLELFEGSANFVQDYESVTQKDGIRSAVGPKPELASLSHWRSKVQKAASFAD